MSADDVRRHICFKRSVGELDSAVADRMLQALDLDASADYASLLRAALFQEPPALVYHSAPRPARGSIQEVGLIERGPAEGWWGADAAGQPYGVYVSAKPDLDGRWALHYDEWDVWEIARGDIPWEHDTLNPGCWRLRSVPPEALRLIPVDSQT